MPRLFKLALLTLVLVGATRALTGEVIDRVVATINGHAILLSDWEEAIAYEAFLNGKALAEISEEERKQTLERIIDQELLLQQLKDGMRFEAEEQTLQQRITEIRKQHAAANDAAWTRALSSYGLSEQTLRERLMQHMLLIRFIDVRLRPGVRIDRVSVEKYYRETLLPRLRQQGAREPALHEVSPKIEQVLEQERVNELLDAWLHNLREESEVNVRRE
jgi:hypothetical protein